MHHSQEAWLKLKKETRGAERIRKDAQFQLETVGIDTELEVLTINWGADAAIAEAYVLKDASEMTENTNSESEKAILQCTSEYVQSQTDLLNWSPSPLTAVPPL